jgi:hypothetical protein
MRRIFITGFCSRDRDSRNGFREDKSFRAERISQRTSQRRAGQGGCPRTTSVRRLAMRSNVPKSWGQYRGGSAQSGLSFEDSNGTLRFITNLPCGATPVVALEIRRTGNAN